MKKLISVLLALSMIAGFGVMACAGSGIYGSDPDFVPVIRFIASSDSHVRDDSDVTPQRIAKMLDLGYEIAANDPNYNSLDAVLVAGDLTNDGTKTEFDKFGKTIADNLRGDTKFIGVVAKNHDGYVMTRKELRSYYKSVTGNDADFHTVINGYHFIGLSASSNGAAHYDNGQIAWLEDQIKEAVNEDPNKPVFVTHHEHVRDTVYGSSSYDGWGVTFFTSVLKKYPQVVDFSGHSHYPVNHPASLWQGAFTAIGTGSLYYAEFTVEKTRTYHPSDAYDVATCWIVELDAANRMRLRALDVNAGEFLCEYVLDNPADPANREHTPEKHEAAASAPAFAGSDKLDIQPTAGGFIIKVPVAASTDGMPVTLYKATAKAKSGVGSESTWVLPKYYEAVEQDTVEIRLKGLKTGEYEISVTAENAYGMASDPISGSAEITEDCCPYCGEKHEGFGGWFINIFHNIAYFFMKLFGKA